MEKLKASSKPARGKSFESVRYSAMLRGELAGIKVTSLVVGALLHRAP